MPKYLTTWKIDKSKMPVDNKENMEIMMKMMEITGQFLKESPGNDWGQFIGETSGFGIVNGSWQDVARVCLQLRPYVDFQVHQVASFDEAIESHKALMK
jgi:hypothetical protein